MGDEETTRKRLSSEYGEPWKPVKGGARVALIYPNTYSVGMSNLGFQTLYHLLNQRDDLTCERVFLPDREERENAEKKQDFCRSMESGSRLSTFDLIAFSVSFELDYLHIVEILQKNQIPPLRSQRVFGRNPMVWIGGAGVTINPEPLAEVADLIFIGEIEEAAEGLVDAFVQSPRKDLKGGDRFLREVRGMEGVYLPGDTLFHFDTEGRVTKIENKQGGPQKVRRRWVEDLDRFPAVSRMLTSHTELNDMYLIEVDRGCGRQCRFCAAGYLYRPPRFRTLEGILRSVREGLAATDRIGLVGTAVSDYPRMGELVRKIRSLRARISISSLRADSVSPDLMIALAQSGHKTLSLAPEGGSQRMRDIMNKGMGEAEILEACRMAFSSKIMNLKLYFMIGLPFETDEDMEALVDLVLKIKKIQMTQGKMQGKIGRVTVSLNAFVPKPHTPFQWFPMNKKDALSKKISYIKKPLAERGKYFRDP